LLVPDRAGVMAFPPPIFCPQCKSTGVAAHCASPPCPDWWKCGECGAYGDMDRIAQSPAGLS
jgi:hypothetical protein